MNCDADDDHHHDYDDGGDNCGDDGDLMMNTMMKITMIDDV